MNRERNPYDEPCPLFGTIIEIGLCSDTTDVVDGAVHERLIVPDLVEHGFVPSLTDEQKQTCMNCLRRELA